MIHLAASTGQLSSLERFGLAVLVEASGLLVVETAAPSIVTLQIGPGTDSDPASLRVEARAGEIQVTRPALARIATLAGAVTEQRSPAEDRHGRVPSAVNPMVEAGLHQSPVISLAGRRLRDAVVAQGERMVRVIGPWPQGRRWAAAFSHDLDVVSAWPLFSALRLSELGRKGRISLASRVAGAALVQLATDPVSRGVTDLLAIERELGIHSTWFIIAGVPSLRSFTRGDVTYSVTSDKARRILDAVTSGGHEIGLHGSFATMTDAEAMASERERLRQVTGRQATGVRQHFLRMRPGATQRAMATAGFEYDATYGFPDRNGFRLGLANTGPGWDAEQERLSGLEEVPLVWMDRAQSKYAGNERPGDWVDEGLALAGAARDAEGLWVGLWHPNLTTALGFPGALEQYRRLGQEILGQAPFVAPLETLVKWRRARRSVIAARVGPEGVPELRATIAGEWPLTLEDGRGKVVQTLDWPRAA